MLEVEHVTKGFHDLLVLNDINFHISDDEIVAMIGPSGCGKSTLLHIIAELLPPEIGCVTYSGRTKSFVFQDDRLLPFKSVWQNISIVHDSEDRETIQKLIEDVGLAGFETYKPHQLSGGMKKRCGIARAFYYQSKLLLMDEPFQGLDYCLRHEMLNMLLTLWNKHKQSILFITHEIDEALTVANRILVLSNRPSTIIKEFLLPPYENRTQETKQLNQIRQEIISLITK